MNPSPFPNPIPTPHPKHLSFSLCPLKMSGEASCSSRSYREGQGLSKNLHDGLQSALMEKTPVFLKCLGKGRGLPRTFAKVHSSSWDLCKYLHCPSFDLHDREGLCPSGRIWEGQGCSRVFVMVPYPSQDFHDGHLPSLEPSRRSTLDPLLGYMTARFHPLITTQLYTSYKQQERQRLSSKIY